MCIYMSRVSLEPHHWPQMSHSTLQFSLPAVTTTYTSSLDTVLWGISVAITAANVDMFAPRGITTACGMHALFIMHNDRSAFPKHA